MGRLALLSALLFLAIGTDAFGLELSIGGKKQNVPVCGGIAGIPCGEKEWCDFPSGAACGIGDRFGTCRPRPEVCPKSFIPVCGCDGKTYPGSCEAAQQGVSTAHAGVCGKQ
jgi:Kazal-type serine protease inhibitor domain